MIPVFLTAFLHHLRYQEFIRILRIKELFNCPKLFGDMPWIFLFYTIDEVLEELSDFQTVFGYGVDNEEKHS